ncbi:MAG TPA: ArsC/Spx/MgsR family protein [Actinomycetota bacterium]|nr:ArsC/Spx/MgsR family protein [Actinomycetota bacterium]
MTEHEIAALAKRAGGASTLVAPTRRAEVEGMTDAQIVAYLVQDPKRLRRPIIDTGDAIHLGFSKAVREALAE